MSDDILLPRSVLSPHDERWNIVEDFLKEDGEIEENEVIKRMTIELDADDVAVVRDLHTEERALEEV